MISEKDLLQAIEECESEPITETKIGKLANFYTIYDHLFGTFPVVTQSKQCETVETPIIRTLGDTDFMLAIDGKETSSVIDIMDELMDALKILQPRIYDSVIQRLSNLDIK